MDDDEVNEVSPGERGELWCHCINSMKGYWKNAEATRKTVTSSGWVKTGDIAYVDTEGKYRIVDRKKVPLKSQLPVVVACRTDIHNCRNSSKSKAIKLPQPNLKASFSSTQKFKMPQSLVSRSKSTRFSAPKDMTRIDMPSEARTSSHLHMWSRSQTVKSAPTRS